jgi:hypothetical protein
MKLVDDLRINSSLLIRLSLRLFSNLLGINFLNLFGLGQIQLGDGSFRITSLSNFVRQRRGERRIIIIESNRRDD